MSFNFVKMHGAGNDFIFVNGFETTLDDPSSLACRVTDRHFGIGADGLILVLPPSVKDADVRMQVFNTDGSEAEMCGNAVRCMALFVHEHKLAEGNPVLIETGDGVKVVEKIFDDSGHVSGARVDMGVPRLDPGDIPVSLDLPQVVGHSIEPLELPGAEWIDTAGLDPRMTCVSMGNPHVVLFCDDIKSIPLEDIGPIIECAPVFPERINVHFAQVCSNNELVMRTWERGSGITQACGTGASATCVAGVLSDKCDRKVLMHLPGGDLIIQWDQKNDHIYMTGPAEEVFSGQWMR